MSARREFISLAELLAGGDDAHSGRRPRLTTILLRTVVLAAVLAGLAFGIIVALTGLGITYPFLFSVFLALLILYELLGSMQPLPPPAVPIREVDDLQAYELPDRPFVEVRRWENRLDWILGDTDRFVRVVLPAISRVVDDRLRYGYSIDREREPERAKEIVGPRVWRFLHPPSKAERPSPRELTTIVRELEKL